LYHVNRKTGEVFPFKGVDNSDVYSIIPDGPDVLWFGNAYPGLLRYHVKTGERRGYRHNPNDPTTLCSGVIDHLLIDREGTLWAATFDGLCQLDSSTIHLLPKAAALTTTPLGKRLTAACGWAATLAFIVLTR
jgi:ligand-binding sensor domain-containing protein